MSPNRSSKDSKSYNDVDEGSVLAFGGSFKKVTQERKKTTVTVEVENVGPEPADGGDSNREGAAGEGVKESDAAGGKENRRVTVTTQVDSVVTSELDGKMHETKQDLTAESVDQKKELDEGETSRA